MGWEMCSYMMAKAQRDVRNLVIGPRPRCVYEGQKNKNTTTTHSCTDVENCCRNVTFRTSRVCHHLLCHMTRGWQRGVQKTHFIHKELQSSAGEHDGRIRSTFLWVDCDIADSSLLPVLKEIPLYVIVYFYIYSTQAFTSIHQRWP